MPGSSHDDRMRIRLWERLAFLDPVRSVLRYRALARRARDWSAGPRPEWMRDQSLKQIREAHDGALFCHGISVAVLGEPVHYAAHESQDHDGIAIHHRDGKRVLTPVQLKEVVPSDEPLQDALQETVAKLRRYAPAPELVVAIHINREGHLDVDALDLEGVEVGSVWLFGQHADAPRWWMLGDLRRGPRHYEFDDPAVDGDDTQPASAAPEQNGNGHPGVAARFLR